MTSKDSAIMQTLGDYYEPLVKSMDDGLFILEMISDDAGRPVDFKFIETDLAFEPQSGPGLAVGKKISEVAPDAGRYWVDAYARVVQTGEPLKLVNEVDPNGRRFDVIATRIGGPGSIRIGVLFRNVTEHARRKEALKRTEERYRMLFESIDEGFCIVKIIFDEDGRPIDYLFLEINPSFEKQTGLHDAVGQTARSMLPQLEGHWFEIYGKVATTGEPIRFQNKAESLGRWFDVYAFRIAAPDQVAMLFNDITERITADERMKDADRRKDEFLAMLAHELRNPLAPIGSAAELLERAAGDEAMVKRASAIIMRQVKHMTGLVDDLLDVSRVTRGLVSLEKSRVDAKRVLAEAVEQVRPSIEAKDHTLTVHTPPEPAWVFGDHTRLVQVLTNLLSNAVKYTPAGGRIGVDMHAVDGQFEIVVTDNGIGIAPEFLASAFNMFAQADRSADRTQGGLGIGLALVKSLVESHGGSVRASSEGPGKGSAFTVRLPEMANSRPGGQDEPGGSPGSGAITGLKVMVVDDNVDAAETLAMLVQTMGHQVMVEHRSRRALERGRKEQPDVFLLDVGLPDMNGHELARQLRSQLETAGAMLVAVTGYGQEQDRDAALRAGFDRYFVKPVDPARLEELFSQIAAGARA